MEIKKAIDVPLALLLSCPYSVTRAGVDVVDGSVAGINFKMLPGCSRENINGSRWGIKNGLFGWLGATMICADGHHESCISLVPFVDSGICTSLS